MKVRIYFKEDVSKVNKVLCRNAVIRHYSLDNSVMCVSNKIDRVEIDNFNKEQCVILFNDYKESFEEKCKVKELELKKGDWINVSDLSIPVKFERYNYDLLCIEHNKGYSIDVISRAIIPKEMVNYSKIEEKKHKTFIKRLISYFN